MTAIKETWVRDDQWSIEITVEGNVVISFTRLPTTRGPLNTTDYKQVSTALQGAGYRRLVE